MSNVVITNDSVKNLPILKEQLLRGNIYRTTY